MFKIWIKLRDACGIVYEIEFNEMNQYPETLHLLTVRFFAEIIVY